MSAQTSLAFVWDRPATLGVIVAKGTGVERAEAHAAETTERDRDVVMAARENVENPAHRRPWTAHEQDVLRMSWGHHTVSAIARQLGRKPRAIYKRAGALGLGRGIVQGFESVTAAALRTGFEYATLCNVLRWAHVHIRPAASFPSERNGRRRMVEPGDVDRAVARWCAAESLQDASRRTGFAEDALRIALRQAHERGEIELDPSRAINTRWRIDPTVIDLVVANRWNGREQLLAASARVGVHEETLRRWLFEAGMTRPKGDRWWRLLPAEVDRVVAERRAGGSRASRNDETTQGDATT